MRLVVSLEFPRDVVLNAIRQIDQFIKRHRGKVLRTETAREFREQTLVFIAVLPAQRGQKALCLRGWS